MAEPKLETLGDTLSGIAQNDPESIDALDSAFAKLAQEKGVTEPIEGLRIAAKADESTGDDAVAADAKDKDKAAAAAKAAADEKVAADKTAAAATPSAEEQAAADKKAADDKAAAEAKAASDKKANELYSDVHLPPNARGASAQAFAAIKARAAADLTERDRKLTESETERAKLQEQLKSVVPAKDMEALRQENEALRKWKASLDVEADPALKARFDTRIVGTHDFIYSKLKATGKITDEHIEQIKKLGGPEQVEWTPIFEKLKDPQLQRLIQAKLDEVETIKFEKEQAVQGAKNNVDEYLAQRAKEFEGASGQHNESTKQVLAGLLGQVPWMVPPTPKADATEAEKAAAKGQTDFVGEVNKTMADCLADDSPQMRAVLLMGVAQHLNLKRTHSAVLAEKEGLTKKLAAAEKSLTEANEKIENFKNGSVNRLRNSNAPVTTGVIETKADPFKDTATDALEKFRASRAA